jgi:hypothetical protein
MMVEGLRDPLYGKFYYPHLIDQETEAQRHKMTYRKHMVESDFEPWFKGSKAHTAPC